MEELMVQSPDKNRIAKNTLLLYFRQILIMLVNLFTVRIILATLGVVDYGIYNLIAGIVSMLGFLNGAMATASQRFFSYDLGRGDIKALQTTFSMSLNIYVIMISLVIILAETLGLWLLNTKLVIPIERLWATKIIYQLSIGSFVCSMLTTPYIAIIIARENMDLYAYISIFEALFKLITAFIVKYLKYDKLIIYCLLIMISSALILIVYIILCQKRYSEVKYKFFWNRKSFQTLLSYTGWNLFGAGVGVVKVQAINILLNIFFGPMINAARGIASQVSSAVSGFSQNFSIAARPQIVKQYAADNIEGVLRLVFQSTKLTFFLMYIIAFPLYLEMPIIMKIWLSEVPQNVVMFTRLVLIDLVIDSISYSLMTAAQATGKIKMYQALVGGILLLNLPCSYIILRLGAPPQSVLIVSIIITIIAFLMRLFILKRLMNFPVGAFLLKVIIPLLKACFISAVPPLLIILVMHESLIRLIITFLCSILSISIIFYLLALQKDERLSVKALIFGYFTKFYKKD
jgi:O-antigen/teichoic acid export membrane protein